MSEKPATPAADGRTQFNLQFRNQNDYLRARELVNAARTIMVDQVEDATGIRVQMSNPAVVLLAMEEYVRLRTESVL